MIDVTIAAQPTRYTDEEHDVWKTLYARRLGELPGTASARFMAGIDAIGLGPDRVPDLADVNRRLAPLTGWRAVPVGGFLPAADFFAMLSKREFPTTVTVRAREHLEYVSAPDIFHDVFGHVPLHADPAFASYLQHFGAVAAASPSPDALQRLTRLFWFTVEFGLIREGGEVRAYGSGLISSSADARNALGPGCDRRPFALDEVMATDFEIDRLQPVLYVVDSFEQLFAEMSACLAVPAEC
ncbi:MAG: phenylalanine 4-monooxygenase [Gemmatimonadota bacterium]